MHMKACFDVGSAHSMVLFFLYAETSDFLQNCAVEPVSAVSAVVAQTHARYMNR